jgi:hypothetical protein
VTEFLAGLLTGIVATTAGFIYLCWHLSHTGWVRRQQEKRAIREAMSEPGEIPWERVKENLGL